MDGNGFVEACWVNTQYFVEPVPYCPGVLGVAAPGGFHAVFGVGGSHFLFLQYRVCVREVRVRSRLGYSL